MVTGDGGILRGDIIAQPYTPLTQYLLTPDYSHVAGAAREGRVCTCGERARTVTRAVRTSLEYNVNKHQCVTSIEF